MTDKYAFHDLKYLNKTGMLCKTFKVDFFPELLYYIEFKKQKPK